MRVPHLCGSRAQNDCLADDGTATEADGKSDEEKTDAQAAELDAGNA